MKSTFLFRARLGWVALLSVFCLSFSFPEGNKDQNCIAEIRAFYLGIEDAYLNADRTRQSDTKAFNAVVNYLQQGLPKQNGECASEVIYRTIDIASRLPHRQQLLDEVAHFAFKGFTTDVNPSNKALYILALATLELNRGDLNSAKVLADSSLTFPNELRGPKQMASTYIIRGYANEGLENYSTAREDFLRAYEYNTEQKGTEHEQLYALNAAGLAALKLEDYLQAKSYTQQARQILESTSNGEQEIQEAYTIYLNLAQIEYFLANKKEAFDHGFHALKIAKNRKDMMRIARAKMVIGELYFEDGKLEKAEEFLVNAKETIESTDDARFLPGIMLMLSQVSKEQGNFSQALAQYERYHAISDSLNNVSHNYAVRDFQKEVATARMKEALTRAEAKTVILHEQKYRSKVSKIAISSALVAAIILLILVTFRLKLKVRSEALLEIEVAKRTKEIERQNDVLCEQTLKLQQSNQELERFAFVASHDLKSPLRNISGFLGLVKRRLKPDSLELVEEYLNILDDHCTHMNVLISDILDYSRIEIDLRSKYVTVDIRGLVDTIKLQMMPTLAENNISIEVKGQAHVLIPPTYISQVVRNLIENGLKYNESLFPRIKVDISQDKDFVEIAINDNGIGIAPEYHESVFEMFKRLHTSDTYTGSGVGLAVCAKIINRIGGSIALDSAPGEGSTFTVRLPMLTGFLGQPTNGNSHSFSATS